jgi:hypothetical protein
VDRAHLIAAGGGVPEALPLPSVGRAAIDAEGRVACPFPEATRTWKRYRGGAPPDLDLRPEDARRRHDPT